MNYFQLLLWKFCIEIASQKGEIFPGFIETDLSFKLVKWVKFA